MDKEMHKSSQCGGQPLEGKTLRIRRRRKRNDNSRKLTNEPVENWK
jgi:hypothetical protein